MEKEKIINLLSFIQNRIDTYYEERVQKTWGGGNILRGKVPIQGDLTLFSNDYLSIAQYPEIMRAMIDSLKKDGNGVLMSGVFLHGDNSQLRLEQSLADFMHAESGILCQSGYAANTGLLQTIAGPQIPVYLDMFAHMSLWDGVHCANAKPISFLHNDVEHLEKKILRHGPGIVLVDSVYSTSGSIAPLKAIAKLCQQHECSFVVDESHSLGTHGPQGAGLVVELGLTNLVHFRTVSLAKAFASRAGFVTCSQRFNEYFKFESKPAIFSSTLLPHEVAGLTAALAVIRKEEWRRKHLHRSATQVREALIQLGYNLNDSASQIVSLESGTEEQTMVLRDALERRGIFGSIFFSPATPKNRAVVRFSLNASLTAWDIERLIKVCTDIREEVGMAHWASTRRLTRSNYVLED